MRRIIGMILAGLAGFLGCTAVLLMVYAPGKAKVTPLNIDSTTKLSGTARALPLGGSGPIKATNKTVVDSAASDGGVAVFDTFTCLMTGSDGPDCVDAKDPQKRLISASTDRFAADRVTAMAVNDAKYVDASEGEREGLLNKWPFDAEQKTYTYWDGTAGKGVDAVYQGEEEIEGLKTYHYLVDVKDAKIELAKGVPGTYSSHKDIWIDPVTGSPIKQTETQVRKFADGKKALDMDLAFTADQVSTNVAAAKKNGSQLALISKGPLFAGILALLAAAGAAFALLAGRRRDDSGRDYADDDTMLDGFGDDTRRRGGQRA